MATLSPPRIGKPLYKDSIFFVLSSLTTPDVLMTTIFAVTVGENKSSKYWNDTTPSLRSMVTPWSDSMFIISYSQGLIAGIILLFFEG